MLEALLHLALLRLLVARSSGPHDRAGVDVRNVVVKLLDEHVFVIVINLLLITFHHAHLILIVDVLHHRHLVARARQIPVLQVGVLVKLFNLFFAFQVAFNHVVDHVLSVEELRGRLSSGADESVPETYRALVEAYYEALAVAERRR